MPSSFSLSALESFCLIPELKLFPGGCSSEKAELLRELQEQGAVYMSDMMTALCSSLPYSNSTIKDLVCAASSTCVTESG